MSTDWDIAYVQRVLDGDKESFRYFIKTYQTMAMSIAMSLVKDNVDAQDVVQSAFVKAYKALGSFNQDAAFSTWLYKIVVNEGLQFLRKKKRRSKIETYKATDEELVAFNDAVKNMEGAERKERVEKALNQLKSKESLVLRLHYLHDEPVSGIADITGFSNSNVKVLLHRARKSFAAIFNHPESRNL